jgi:hypothetical protein
MEVEGHLEEIRLTIKRGPIDNKPRELIIHPDFIRFEAGHSSNNNIELSKFSIKECRFGICWISGYKFTFGREYQIFIKDKLNQVLKIHFKSFYGVKKVEYHNLYSEILGNLWKYYFRNIANNFLQQFWDDKQFSICGVVFSSSCLKLKKVDLLREEVLTITWDKVRTKDYQTYFVIYSVDNPTKLNVSFNYLNDWNTDILRNVIITILSNIDTK